MGGRGGLGLSVLLSNDNLSYVQGRMQVVLATMVCSV